MSVYVLIKGIQSFFKQGQICLFVNSPDSQFSTIIFNPKPNVKTLKTIRLQYIFLHKTFFS